MINACYQRPRSSLFNLPFVALVGIAIMSAMPVAAAVYHSRESALELAFGSAAQVVPQELFLLGKDQVNAARLAGSEIPSRLIQRYEGYVSGQLVGYAYFETHTVRSLPETLMIVLDPTGRVAAVHVLAFHEPETYMPHEGFLRQFDGRVLDSELSLRTGIQGVAGSTFTANAVTAAVRRVLAVHQTLAGQTGESD